MSTFQQARRVLAVFAHPDDAEIWAGGTLLAHRACGDRTAVCILTHGDTDRAAEAAQGAEVLGASLYHLSFTDRAVRADGEAIAAVSDVLRREQPQLLLTHWQGDSHPDHVACWHIVRAAIMLSEIEAQLSGVFWCDTYNSIGAAGLFQPDCLIDVSTCWSRKLAAIQVHTSQRPEGYVAMTTRQCSMYGARSGVPFAEGFQRAPLFGRGLHAAASLWDWT